MQLKTLPDAPLWMFKPVEEHLGCYFTKKEMLFQIFGLKGQQWLYLAEKFLSNAELKMRNEELPMLKMGTDNDYKLA
jgi:hypothetical protein